MTYDPSTIIWQTGERRCRLIPDDAPLPTNEGGCPVWRLRPCPYESRPELVYGTGLWSRDHTWLASQPHAADELARVRAIEAHVDEITSAIEEYRAEGCGNQSLAGLMERWLEIEHQGDLATRVAPDGTMYLAVTTDTLREYWGAVDDPDSHTASMDEVEAWLDGDVWSWVVEESVTTHHVDTCRGVVSEYDTTEWEPVESCGGHYGCIADILDHVMEATASYRNDQ